MKYVRVSLAMAAISLFSIYAIARADNKQPAPAPAPAASPKSAPEEVPQGGIEILRMVLCKNVKDHEPDQEVTTAKVGDSVVGWTQVRSGLGEVTITHRWLHEDKTMSDVPLEVKSSPWRTWSRLTLTQAGKWKWQVVNSQGSVLKETAFSVIP